MKTNRLKHRVVATKVSLRPSDKMVVWYARARRSLNRNVHWLKSFHLAELLIGEKQSGITASISGEYFISENALFRKKYVAELRAKKQTAGLERWIIIKKFVWRAEWQRTKTDVGKGLFTGRTKNRL